jgi:CheY-like chemotaxis protein
MPRGTRVPNSYPLQRSRSGEGLSPAAAEDIRIARSLIGTTPAQLAAYIGAHPDPQMVSAPQNPVRCLDTLAVALRTAIRWYHDGPEAPANPDANGTLEAVPEGVEVHGLVRQYLTLRSEWESREARLLAAQIAENAAPRQRKHIRSALLVDDASDILVTVGAFLGVLAFDVFSASNADMALEILASGRQIDLLVTDHAMPGMTGCELVFQACQQYPALRALIITGYPNSDGLANLPPGVALLGKPFRRAELIEHVRLLFEPAESHGTADASMRRA